jgi:hydrogenase maturation factor
VDVAGLIPTPTPDHANLSASFGIDPLGLIASGALLVATAPVDAGTILRALEEAGIRAVQIGTLEEEDAGVMAVTKGKERPLPRFATDELARAF